MRNRDYPIPGWLEGYEHHAAVAEAKRLLPSERERERQLIREAEHEAELRFLRRKAELLERVAHAK